MTKYKKIKIPNNTIKYWADKKIKDFTDTLWNPELGGAFGEASVISHTFEDGIGIITFDQDLTTITNGAFSNDIINDDEENWDFIYHVIIPDSVTSISNGAFANQFLEELDLSTTKVESIGYSAFINCVNLKTLNLNNNKLSILLNDAFNVCGVEKILFPKSITTITSAFGGCDKLLQLNLQDCVNLSTIQSSFGGCYNIKSINLKNCVKLQSINGLFNLLHPNIVIDLLNCDNLLTISGSFNMCNIQILDLRGCIKLSTISNSFTNTLKLSSLNLSICNSLTVIDSSFSNSSN